MSTVGALEGREPIETPEPARERFYRRLAERVAGMSDEEASSWIAEHALFSLAGREELRPGVRDRLRRRRQEVAAYNLYAVSRFQEIAEALAGLPLCALKGIYLQGTVYRGDPESRKLSDVDLLVPAERVEEAVARLAALGLAEIPTSRRLRDVSHERVLIDGRLTVEIHSRLGIKHGWASTWDDVAPRPERVHDRAVFALDRETTLVHLVSHFVKHRPFSRLIWAEDILRWIDRGVDGGRALARARDLGAERSVLAGLRILRRALGPLGLPGAETASLKPAGRLCVWLNERLLWRDLAADPWSAGPGGAIGRTLSVLLLADGMADRGRFLRAKLSEVRRL